MTLRTLLERDLSAGLGGLHDLFRSGAATGRLTFDRVQVRRMRDLIGAMRDLAVRMEDELAVLRLGEIGKLAERYRDELAAEAIAEGGKVVPFPVIARPIPGDSGGS